MLNPLVIAKGCVLDQPIFLEGDESRVCNIVLEEGSVVTIVDDGTKYERHITLHANAMLNYIQLQTDPLATPQKSHLIIQQKQNSRAQFVSCITEGDVSENTLHATLEEQGAVCHTAGFYHAKSAQQMIKHHIRITHAAPNCESDMLYKGIADQGKIGFEGILQVMPLAQKTRATQLSQQLLLSSRAEGYAKPILEINTDDVLCKHGATIGYLDEAVLFYLRSRGLSKEEAMMLFLNGFAETILQRISHPSLQASIREQVLQPC